MSQSMFQKEFNDEISVRDMSIDNPYPLGLDVRSGDNVQIFYAKPGFVLKSIYSSLDSLSAFSSDGASQVYMIYPRENKGQDSVFIEHYADSSEERLVTLSVWDLPEEVQAAVPANARS